MFNLERGVKDFKFPGVRVRFGGPFGTVPELFFEKKQLISALQQLLVSYQRLAV